MEEDSDRVDMNTGIFGGGIKGLVKNNNRRRKNWKINLKKKKEVKIKYDVEKVDNYVELLKNDEVDKWSQSVRQVEFSVENLKVPVQGGVLWDVTGYGKTSLFI